MSNKSQAIVQFLESFGLPVYDEQSVPSGENRPQFPYLTYEERLDDFDHPVSMTFSLWYRSTSWKNASDKVEEIEDIIGRGGKIIPCTGGAIWVRKGSPFAQRLGDAMDDLVKRYYCNIAVEYITAD